MATIKKRGQSYQFRVYYGYDSDGKQIEKTKTWKPPEGWTERKAEKEAQRLAALFEEQVRSGGLVGGNVKLSEFSDYWLKKYAEPNLKPKTVTRYKQLLVRINQSLGHLPISKIHPGNLLEFYDDLAAGTPKDVSYRCKVNLKEKIKENKFTQAAFCQRVGISQTTLRNLFHGQNISARTAEAICQAMETSILTLFSPAAPDEKLSPSTIRHYHRLLSNILGDAVKWQYIPYNPCMRIEAPKAGKSEISYLDDDQAKRLLSLLQKETGIYRRAVSLLLLTGLRRGELLGLEWRDIDFGAKTIQVLRTSQYLPGRGIFTETPKTKASKRIIAVSDQVVKLLQEQLLWQQLQAARLKENWTNNGRVIVSENGEPMNPDRLTQWFGKFIRRTDLPQIHLHSLRHTYASLCIANGVPLTAVAAQLGHSNVATTATIYAHAIRSAQLAAAVKMDTLFADIL